MRVFNLLEENLLDYRNFSLKEIFIFNFLLTHFNKISIFNRYFSKQKINLKFYLNKILNKDNLNYKKLN
jgi:hypothetical protein